MNLDRSSSYQLLNEALLQTESQLHPSEAHGLLCGIVCGEGSDQLPFKEWVGGHHLSHQADQLLASLHQEVHAQFTGDSFALRLYLPADEETNLTKRAEALTLWCQGFLIGLKLAGVTVVDTVPAEMKEALNDLAALSKIEYEAVIDSEEDEVAYAELVEYVRVAAMLIHDSHKGTQHDYNDHL